VGGIHGEASKHGEYAHCFVDGALGAFDAYAKEVLANQLVGVFSTFLDIDKVLNNKAYKGYLQLAAHSAFNYESPFPIYSRNQIRNKLGKYDFVAVGKQKLGTSYDSNEEKLVDLTVEWKGGEYRLRSLSREITIVKTSTVPSFTEKLRYATPLHAFSHTDCDEGVVVTKKDRLLISNDMHA